MNEPDRGPPNTRLHELMARAGVTNANLGRLTGVTRNYVHLIRVGQRRVTIDWAKKAAPWLSCDWADLLEEPGTPVRKAKIQTTRMGMARRIQAVRWAWWDSFDDASRALGFPIDLLREVEEGRSPAPEEFLVRFCDLTRVPADYIMRGITDPRPVPPAVRERIAQRYPDEIQPLRPLSKAALSEAELEAA